MASCSSSKTSTDCCSSTDFTTSTAKVFKQLLLVVLLQQQLLHTHAKHISYLVLTLKFLVITNYLSRNNDNFLVITS